MIEGLLTLHAFIWLLPSVDAVVLSEASPLEKGFLILITLTGLHSRLSPLMLKMEAIIFLTWVWLFTETSATANL